MNRLGWSLGITAVVMIAEFIGGWLSGSIALISDAAHMFTHAIALGISMSGILIARKPVCHHRTFGLLRAEVVAAFVNGLLLLVATVWIVIESIDRILHPQPILTIHMLTVAILGLAVNVVSIFLLEGSRKGDMNVHSVFLHMVSDAASSVAIVVAAVVIRFTNWVWLDPAVSIGIAFLILLWAGSLLSDSLRVLLEMAPKGHDIMTITDAMTIRFPEIIETQNEHIWTITPSIIVFTAHLVVDGRKVQSHQINEWLEQIEHWLKATFDVSESTLQVKLTLI
jgi:cobalt-zinc-cadmium efflux system protein